MNDKLKVLAVDDDPTILASIATLLERGGYEVIRASSGQDALDSVKKTRPGLVLLDVVLPDLSGLEVCARIKADPDLRNTLVMLLSGIETSREAEVIGLDSGADGYMIKPVGARELLARVKSMARIIQAEAALRDVNEELERRVLERTEELARVNQELRDELEHRKRIEETLQRERDKLKDILDATSDGVYIVNRRYEIEYANPVIENQYGPVNRRKCHEYFHGVDEACAWCKSPQVFKGESVRWEWHDPKTGKTFDVHDIPIKNTDGSISKLKLLHDVTQRKQSEEALRTAFSEIKALKDRLEAENIYFRKEIGTEQKFRHIVGQSNALKYVLYRAEQVAPTDTTVLILGETGTGKELVAAAIHQMSRRKDRVLVTVNCAALPPNLIESELFGREKGAFTGADARRIGRFEIADGSTICLDEIGELPLEVQGKLLRVIQHGEFQRLGSPHTVKVNVRIIATTNRNLEEEVQKGRFRKDLYYRLNVFPITLPPLRQRKEDVPLLVQAFLERFVRKLGKEIRSVPKEVMRALQEYDWPGNVRELENVIERAVILCQGSVLQLADCLEETRRSAPPDSKTLEEAEREHILKALAEARWRINGKQGAAALLGLNPSTLRARMQKLGIRRPEVSLSD